MKVFAVGEKVRIHATPTSSIDVKIHNNEIVTIKAPCEFYSKACYIEEYDGLWKYNCFKSI